MKIIVSYWSSPYFNNRSFSWIDFESFCCSVILSCNLLLKHYGELSLYCDDYCYNLFAKKLGIQFTDCDLLLNKIDEKFGDSNLWSFGRYLTFLAQKEPFLHFDLDFFAFNKPLVNYNASLILQNKEDLNLEGYKKFYDIEFFKNKISCEKELWVSNHSYNCGIFGGTNLDFIQYYCNKLLEIIKNPANKEIIQDEKYKSQIVCVLDQYFLSSMILNKKIKVETLINNNYELLKTYSGIIPIDSYSHLTADLKRDKISTDMLKKYVKENYTRQYGRI